MPFLFHTPFPSPLCPSLCAQPSVPQSSPPHPVARHDLTVRQDPRATRSQSDKIPELDRVPQIDDPIHTFQPDRIPQPDRTSQPQLPCPTLSTPPPSPPIPMAPALLPWDLKMAFDLMAPSLLFSSCRGSLSSRLASCSPRCLPTVRRILWEILWEGTTAQISATAASGTTSTQLTLREVLSVGFSFWRRLKEAKYDPRHGRSKAGCLSGLLRI